MKVNAIKSTMLLKSKQNLMFKGNMPKITFSSGVDLNQPAKDVFQKSEKPIQAVAEKHVTKEDNDKFELPKDRVFKKPIMSTKEKPYCQFDNDKVNLFVNAREKAIPALAEMLNNAKDEAEICEGLYIANSMAMENVKGVDKMYYGTFSKFNENRSPNVQSLLSGVYRRILVPDTFGPLVKMLADNIKEPPQDPPFDPNESIGGAILELIKAPKINPL